MKKSVNVFISLVYIMVFASCDPGKAISTVPPDYGEPQLSTSIPTSNEDVTQETITPTLLAIFNAVAKEDVVCFFGNNVGYDATVSLRQFSIVEVVGIDITREWILVRLKEFTDCWIQSTSLELNGDVNLLPFITDLLPPSKISTQFDVTQLVNQTPYSPVELRWEILSYDCNSQGRATGVLVKLNAKGGIPPYIYSPELPMYAKPEQVVSVKVNSNTLNGEPSGAIKFTIPRASDFKCDKQGNNPVSTPVPATPNIKNPPVSKVDCNDGKDNDNDGLIDYPQDPGCDSPTDTHE